MSSQPDPSAIQTAIDKIEIGEMQSRYMFALDWYDGEVYASLFTDDAVIEWPGGRAEGREAISTACVRVGAYFGRLAAADAAKKAPHLRHFVTNTVIDIHGERARARSYWFDLDNDNKPRWPYLAAYGYYEDDLVRTPDGWRYTHRKVVNEMTGESAAENPAW